MGYFKPWRRRIGVITLAMACVFMTEWLRSRDDGYAFELVWGSHKLLSFNESVIWTRSAVGYPAKMWPLPKWRVQYGRNVMRFFLGSDHLKWSRRWCGFGFGQFDERLVGMMVRHGTRPFWSIPYWSIVLSLTLISAYLLLSMPRKSNQNKISEPIAEEVK